MASAGRPTILTEELAEEIVRRVSEGRYITDILDDEDMPSDRTFYNWSRSDDDFFKVTFQARVIGALAQLDKYERELRNPEEGASIGLIKERMHHARWKVSKLLPQHFGDKLDVTTGGEKLPARVEVLVVDPSEDSE